jgi:hypothetical protein
LLWWWLCRLSWWRRDFHVALERIEWQRISVEQRDHQQRTEQYGLHAERKQGGNAPLRGAANVGGEKAVFKHGFLLLKDRRSDHPKFAIATLIDTASSRIASNYIFVIDGTRSREAVSTVNAVAGQTGFALVGNPSRR